MPAGQRDPLVDVSPTATSSPRGHFAITPHDDNALPIRPKVLYVTVAGALSLEDEDGVVVTYPAVPVGLFCFSPVKVRATGTTATVVGHWK